MEAPTRDRLLLPAEAEAAAIKAALQHAYDLLERVQWAVNDVTALADNLSALRTTVTFESMGVLADVRANLNARIGDFQQIAARIDDSMLTLGEIRARQATDSREEA